MGSTVGSWAFVIGVIMALVLGVFGPLSTLMTTLLMLLGLIVGFLNVTQRESKTFLLAAVSLVIVSNFGRTSLETIEVLVNMLNALMVLFVPATIIVALKTVFVAAKK